MVAVSCFVGKVCPVSTGTWCAKGSIVPEARPGPEPIKKLAPVRFQFPRRLPPKLKKRHARLRRSLTGAEGDFSFYVDARIPANSRLECCLNDFPDSFKVLRIRTRAEYDQDNKVNVYSDAVLLPQDFEIVDAVSQRQPEAQSRT